MKLKVLSEKAFFGGSNLASKGLVYVLLKVFCPLSSVLDWLSTVKHWRALFRVEHRTPHPIELNLARDLLEEIERLDKTL